MEASSEGQAQVDRDNAEFWDELCGSNLARELGVVDHSPESIARYDAGYLATYPYLAGYVPASVSGQRVLEIGLGYGTLGSLLVARGADYRGVDIAQGPVAMMRQRLRRAGVGDPEGRVVRASALELPFADAEFDRLYSVGCLHHTGSLERALAEVRRVLRPGGVATVMVYNARSLRRLRIGVHAWLRGRDEVGERREYDANSRGDAAPMTEFVTRRELRSMLEGFDSVEITSRNFADVSLLRGHVILPRRLFLGLPARIAGLDLYAVAR